MRRIVAGELSDPTLSFQLSRGFVVIGVARDYLRHDPESHGHAAVIEWLNPAVATAEDYAARKAWASSSCPAQAPGASSSYLGRVWCARSVPC